MVFRYATPINELDGFERTIPSKSQKRRYSILHPIRSAVANPCFRHGSALILNHMALKIRSVKYE